MTILWPIHLYPPVHNCGAEYMAHGVNKFLMARGHHARVLLYQANRYKITRAYEYEGVTVYPPANELSLAKNADVLITHLDYTQAAIRLARQAKRPCVQFVHNDSVYQSILDAPEVNIVYNSEWIKEKVNYPNNSFVLTPPCDYRHYDVNEDPEASEYITLINIDFNKGGEVLQKIAKAMPDKKFLAVMGSYSVDDKGQITDQPGNVKIIPNTNDILSVYRQTRVLIMPSKYESWGRTATEAMCSGIPVVCAATPGLVENCDKAGLFVDDRDDVDQWVRWIKRLDDKKFYKEASKKAKQRSRELDPIKKLEEFEQWLMNLK
jgi:glycosyltransferase involved in cell wall biosynthesis